MKRGLLTLNIDLDQKGQAPDDEYDYEDQIDTLTTDFQRLFRGTEIYSRDNKNGRFQLILPAGMPFTLRDACLAWFQAHPEINIEIQGAFIEWSRPEEYFEMSFPRHLIHYTPLEEVIWFSGNKDDEPIPMMNKTVYLEAIGDATGYYFHPSGRLAIACFCYHPGMQMKIWHHVCLLLPETDIFDCLDVKHDD